jgi:predicted ATPase
VIPRFALEGLIHLPGLRGNPERAYRVTGVSDRFPGPFQEYTASILEVWQEQQDERLAGVREDLKSLRLTHHVETRRLDDTRVEVRLGRCMGESSGERDLVNIADVGFGASQALPVVVALRAARKNQMVHIEQPELHLHPNAQVAMADLLVAAIDRGARLIVETHSSVLLRALQLKIAERGKPLADQVAFHWFHRDPTGASVVKTAEIQPDGSVGDWPVDFADVEMDVQRRFIQASAKRRRERR